MATHITNPTIIEAAGTLPKRIVEFVGRVNSKTDYLTPSAWWEQFEKSGIDLDEIIHTERQPGTPTS